MAKMGTWLEQWERVQRYYSWVEKITNGMPPPNKDCPKINLMDQAYAFFIFCYHLKDWIDSDETLDLPEKLADNFVHRNENAYLQICGDICNGIKHLKREPEKVKRPQQPEFDEKAIESHEIVDGKEVSQRWKIFVSTDLGRINVLDLATECMEKWREFIEQNISREEILS